MDDTLFIEIQRLCRLVHEQSLQELAITRPDFSITMTAVKTGVVEQTGTVSAIPSAAPAETAAAPETTPQQEGYAVTSPLIGIFYRSSSPDTPAFVEVGDTVEAGQTICIVEAMKVFNEITTDHAGTVIRIPTENGTLVHVDQPLVIIDPTD